MILQIGKYRLGNNIVQEDDGGAQSQGGAAPRGPYIGQEAHHWSSTQRVYDAFFRRDNAQNSFYEFIVRYIRA